MSKKNGKAEINKVAPMEQVHNLVLASFKKAKMLKKYKIICKNTLRLTCLSGKGQTSQIQHDDAHDVQYGRGSPRGDDDGGREHDHDRGHVRGHGHDDGDHGHGHDRDDRDRGSVHGRDHGHGHDGGDHDHGRGGDDDYVHQQLLLGPKMFSYNKLL